ncbi:MAG: hypothetical protein K1X94_32985 [Sandaracinaceae bacterium]|nr:hypothetical protein [Sandaracinaceae bacterium]
MRRSPVLPTPLALLATTLLAACAGPRANEAMTVPVASIVASAHDHAPTGARVKQAAHAMPLTAAQLTAAQRAALQPMLARYGSGWWLTSLETQYTLAIVETPTEHTLELTARGGSGLRGVVHVLREGELRHDRLEIPAGPELSAEDRAAAERIVVAARTAWINDLEGRTRVVDLARGLSALLGDTPRQSRRLGGMAVFYTQADDFSPLLAVVVDLAGSRLVEVAWHDVPPTNATGLVPPADIAAIDEAMRRHGDFGVYGDVTPGLVAMARDHGVSVRPSQTAGRYEVTVSSRDGNGHTLGFHVDVATRTLGGMTAEHSVGADEVLAGE